MGQLKNRDGVGLEISVEASDLAVQFDSEIPKYLKEGFTRVVSCPEYDWREQDFRYTVLRSVLLLLVEEAIRDRELEEGIDPSIFDNSAQELIFDPTNFRGVEEVSAKEVLWDQEHFDTPWKDGWNIRYEVTGLYEVLDSWREQKLLEKHCGPEYRLAPQDKKDTLDLAGYEFS